MRKWPWFLPAWRNSDEDRGIEEADESVSDEGSDAEHQMAHRLGVTADAEVPGTELVLEPGIGALRHGADFVQFVVSIRDVDEGATGPFGEDLDFAVLVGTRVDVDDGDAALREGILDDGLGVIGGVHDVVAPGDALLAGPGERDGDLAVMGRGRSEDGGDRDASLADIEMQLVADPRTGEALGVALEADIAGGRQFSAHFGDRLGALALQPGGRLGGRRFTLARPPAARLGRRWRRLVRWLAPWLLARLDLGGIARQMAKEVFSQTMTDQLLMHPLGQGLIGELPEYTRELGFARKLVAALPAADVAERAVGLKTLDQRDSGWDVELRLADKGARDGRAIFRRAARPAVWGGDVGFQTQSVEDDDQLLELGRERINFLGDVREQPELPSDPATHISNSILAHGHPLAPSK